jgi:hypothetical protein
MNKHLEKPSNPENTKAKVARCLGALLEGKKINRKDFNNASLHSWISTLRNQRLIPIESIETQDGTCDYFMKPEEIIHYKDPHLRKEQKAEMKRLVDNRRKQRARKILKRLTRSLGKNSVNHK